MRRVLAFALLCSALGAPALAHDGPPYPIFVDEVVAAYTVSIWADPDVGEGTFYYYVEGPPSARDVRIEAVSEPRDGSAAQVHGISERAPAGAPYQQLGTLPFEHRGSWRTRFLIRDEGVAGPVLGELSLDLDVTPPGLGFTELVWYAVPFLAAAALWLRIFLAQRRHEREVLSGTTPS